MFPNLRLMIVAISASLLAIVCAMALFIGLFAAFSVAHEPFSTLTSNKPPLQIAFADDITAPVADGKPAPFGVRFQVNAPQVPNGPVIVAVPQAIDRAAPPDVPLAAEPAASPEANASLLSAVPSDDTRSSPQDVMAGPAEPLTDSDTKISDNTTDAASEKTSEMRPEGAAGNEAATVAKTQPQSPAPDRPDDIASARHHPTPQTRIVAREADNPASVTVSPAPTFARKVTKRRKLAAHLRQSHHFRRPRTHQIAGGQTQGGYSSGGVQPNAYQPATTGYATGTYAQSTGIMQPGFAFTPAVIRPRVARFRHTAPGN